MSFCIELLQDQNHWDFFSSLDRLENLNLPRCRINPVAAVPKTPASTPAVLDRPSKMP